MTKHTFLERSTSVVMATMDHRQAAAYSANVLIRVIFFGKHAD